MNEDMFVNMSSQNFEPVGEAGIYNEENDDGNFNDFKLENIGKPFWNLSNSSFPDPIADPKGFIESCHFDTTKLPLELNTYLYFLTKHINENGIDFSIAASYPGILSKFKNVQSLGGLKFGDKLGDLYLSSSY